jgi:hypothetical protein
MKKAILLAAVLALATVSAPAQMAWTLKQCTDKFGAFQPEEVIAGNRTDYKWGGDNRAPIEIIFIHGNTQASRVIVSVRTKTVTYADFADFVKIVCPGFTWHDTLPYQGAKFALLSDGPAVYWGDHWISAWTEADDEAAKK